MKPEVSVILPCYNEEIRFVEGANHFLNYLITQKYDWEIILVNDGSVDKTLSLMKNLEKKHVKKIKIISYENNKGKGFAIKKGVQIAEGKIIVFSDIDHSVNIKTLEKFFLFFNKREKVVIGSRRIGGAELNKRQNIIRETLGRCFTFFVKIIIDKKVTDATCGFKGFTNETAKKVFSKVTIFNWAFDAEIIFILRQNNINYIQCPVEWSDAKGTKVNIFTDSIKSLFGLIKIRINGLQSKYN